MLRALRRLAPAILAGLIAASPAMGQIGAADRATVATLFADLAADPAQMRTLVEATYGAIPDGQWLAFERYLGPILADPAYADTVADRLPANLGAAGTPDDVFNIGVAVAQEVAVRGLSRLPAKQQLYFIGVAIDILRWAAEDDPSVCVDLIFGEGDPITQAQLEFRFLAQATPAYLDAYFSVSRAAVLAEIHDTPPPGALTSARHAAALAAYQEALTALVLAAPNPEALLLVATEPDRAPPGDVCAFGILTLGALPEVEPADRNDVILMMILEMQVAGG